MMTLTIAFPVYNEEKRLRDGVEKTVRFLNDNQLFDYRIIIVDNGSTDNTEQIGHSLQDQYPNVKYIRIGEKGVGVAFRKGLENCKSTYYGYMDIDLSTDLKHLIEVKQIFAENPDIKIINGSRNSRDSNVIGRKIGREITSRGLKWILKILFSMKIDDALCGFKFFDRETLLSLASVSSNENGWFYIIEIMLRAENRHIAIKEIPVVWTDDYNTTVHVFKLIKEYLTQIIRLFIDFNIRGNK